MHSRDRDPQSKAEAGVDTAADRRRPGRSAEVSPQLKRLLRGQVDPDAPADPVLRSPRPALDRDALVGGVVVAALILTGVLIRFAI